MSDPRPVNLFLIGALFTAAVIVVLVLILVPPQGF